MPVRIAFEKALADRLIKCLNDGTPIEGIRTANDCLMLAGVSMWAAGVHGFELSGRDVTGKPNEHVEADVAQMGEEFARVLRFVALLSEKIQFGQYDREFDEEVIAEVNADGPPRVLKGSKRTG